MGRYRAEFKGVSATESWSGIGTYGSEAQAISSAEVKKRGGARMVRVVDLDANGSTVYSG